MWPENSANWVAVGNWPLRTRYATSRKLDFSASCSIG